jgi:uncharacterized membrane protein YdjX (TVP38/TMEM64 family)
VARYVRIALVALVIVLAAVLVSASGLIDHVRDEEQLRETVESAGLLGPVLFIGLMVLLVPLNVPGVLFVVPSVALFGPVGGVLLSLLGGFLASAVGVVAARRLGRPAFEARMPPRIRKLEERLARHGFWGVAVLRMLTYLLQPVDWLCGISSIPMRTVLAGTFVGLIPPTLVISLGGGSLLGRVL